MPDSIRRYRRARTPILRGRVCLEERRSSLALIGLGRRGACNGLQIYCTLLGCYLSNLTDGLQLITCAKSVLSTLSRPPNLTGPHPISNPLPSTAPVLQHAPKRTHNMQLGASAAQRAVAGGLRALREAPANVSAGYLLLHQALLPLTLLEPERRWSGQRTAGAARASGKGDR